MYGVEAYGEIEYGGSAELLKILETLTDSGSGVDSVVNTATGANKFGFVIAWGDWEFTETIIKKWIITIMSFN